MRTRTREGLIIISDGDDGDDEDDIPSSINPPLQTIQAFLLPDFAERGRKSLSICEVCHFYKWGSKKSEKFSEVISERS